MLSKSIDFLLECAGPVIKYRLRKEILKDITNTEEENLLEQIYHLPYFILLKGYRKQNGYIGNGMHSWDHWRGQTFHETPLQDGEAAARLLAYYAIPKTHPIVSEYVKAMRNEEILCKEFSYISPEVSRFKNRFLGFNNGNSLMALMNTMQAMLGYGDDYEDLKEFQKISLKGFQRVLKISSLDEITKFNPNAKRRYNYPYIEAEEYFPNSYTLAMLAYTHNWRTKENIQMISQSLNHINTIMKMDNNMHVRIKGRYIAPCFALIRPLRAFQPNIMDSILYRRPLSEIAMLSVGNRVDIIQESIINIEHALDKDGILRMNVNMPYNKYFPTPYADVRLEADDKSEKALLCDLTFWAVQFLHLAKKKDSKFNTFR